MKATTRTERQDSKNQDSKNQESKRQKTELDNRYGQIGISAVAAAVCPKGEKKNGGKEPRLMPYDRD